MAKRLLVDRIPIPAKTQITVHKDVMMSLPIGKLSNGCSDFLNQEVFTQVNLNPLRGVITRIPVCIPVLVDALVGGLIRIRAAGGYSPLRSHID